MLKGKFVEVIPIVSEITTGLNHQIKNSNANLTDNLLEC